MNDFFEPGTTVPTSEHFVRCAGTHPYNDLYLNWDAEVYEAINGNRSEAEILQAVEFRQTPTHRSVHSALVETTKAAEVAARAHERYQEQYEAWRAGRGRREPKPVRPPNWREANFWREYQKSRLGAQVFIDTYGRNGTGSLPPRSGRDDEAQSSSPIGFRSLRSDEDVKEIEASLFAGCKRCDRGPTMIRRLCYEADYVSVAAVDFSGGIWGLLLGQLPNEEQFHFTCLWVRPEVRRRLVATKLVRRALADFPGRELSAVSRTADEKAYWSTRSKVRVEVLG